MNSSDVIQVSEVNLPVIQENLIAIQDQLIELTNQVAILNTTILYVVGVCAAVGVCVLFYKFIKIFF